MTKTNRIVLNTVATYARTVMAMVMGLFSSRWVFNALGKDDFGLFGVVGGIIVFVNLLNGVLAAAVARYYAYALGEAEKMSSEQAEEHLLRWFNAALSIHWILPLLLMAIGWPIGEYALHHWLVVPAERIASCIWVYRISLFSAFINMISVPYIAMYQARQLIAELSFWGVVTTIANFAISYFMLYYAGDRLLMYALLLAIVPALVLLIQIMRARKHFGVCHLRIVYLFDFNKLRKMFAFAFGDFFGWIGATLRDQGSVFVVNRHFGPGLNAACSIAQRVITYTMSLSSAISSALQPAITTALGSANLVEAKSLALRSCKFSALMILLFAVPVALEIDKLLELWLVTPPEYSGKLCRYIMVAFVIMKFGWGQHMAILANGRIIAFQIVLGCIAASGVIILSAMMSLGLGPMSVGYMLITVFSLMTLARILFARYMLGFSIRAWIKCVVYPITCILIPSIATAYSVTIFFDASILRILLTSLSYLLVFALGSWFYVLDSQEKAYIAYQVKMQTLKRIR